VRRNWGGGHALGRVHRELKGSSRGRLREVEEAFLWVCCAAEAGGVPAMAAHLKS
jgi:hypothetical protein